MYTEPQGTSRHAIKATLPRNARRQRIFLTSYPARTINCSREACQRTLPMHARGHYQLLSRGMPDDSAFPYHPYAPLLRVSPKESTHVRRPYLTWPNRFALGAATGTPARDKSCRVTGWAGQRTPTKPVPAVMHSGTTSAALRISVSGPERAAETGRTSCSYVGPSIP